MPCLDDLLERLRGECSPAGLDLLQPLRIEWYNSLVEAPLRLEDFGSGGHLAVVIGNTRALWPVFLDAIARDPGLAASLDPLDHYTSQVLTRATSALGVPARARFAHVTGRGAVAMQRLAHVAGLAYLTESQLCVHPRHGPWIALRGVISVAVPGPPGSAPAWEHPCGGCAGRCLPAFRRALATLQAPPGEAGARARLEAWVACRDACPVGRQYRYSDDQIRYHYLSDRALLRRYEDTALAGGGAKDAR